MDGWEIAFCAQRRDAPVIISDRRRNRDRNRLIDANSLNRKTGRVQLSALFARIRVALIAWVGRFGLTASAPAMRRVRVAFNEAIPGGVGFDGGDHVEHCIGEGVEVPRPFLGDWARPAEAGRAGGAAAAGGEGDRSPGGAGRQGRDGVSLRSVPLRRFRGRRRR